MKPTQSIYILLSLFLMFSCDDNSVEPLVCDEGFSNVDDVCVCDEELTNVDGVCTLVCDEGLTNVDGECVFVCEEGVTECYYQGDLDVLQDIIDVNESLSGEEPLEIGIQVWVDGRLNDFGLTNNQLTSLPESIGDLSNLESLYLQFNQLTTLPESIGDLSSLTRLYLSSNQLTTLPESFCNLSIDWGGGNELSPYSLLIYNNQLCSSIPTCIEDYLGEQDCDD